MLEENGIEEIAPEKEAQQENPAEETQAEETPEEKPAEEAQAEETPEEEPAEESPKEKPAEETLAEETPEEEPGEETQAEETPEEEPGEETQAEETPEEKPGEETQAEETPEEEPGEETQAEETPEEKPAEETQAEETPEEDEESRIRKISNRIVMVLLAAAVVFTAYVMICSARGQAVNILGKSVLKVVTGSMEPSIHVGDFIKVEKVNTKNLKKGDIITFVSRAQDVKGMLVTHRIISIAPDGSFVTQGDANPISDELTVKPEDVVGKYTGKLRFFIWVSSFADTKKLLMLLVIIPTAIAAVYEVRTLWRVSMAAVDEKREDAKAYKERLIREAIEKEKERLAAEHYGQDTEVMSDGSNQGNEKENGDSDHSV